MGMCTVQLTVVFHKSAEQITVNLLPVGRYLLLPSPLRVPSSFLLLILSIFITMASVRGTGLQIKEKIAECEKTIVTRVWHDAWLSC
jgi:hypothetical protein